MPRPRCTRSCGKRYRFIPGADRHAGPWRPSAPAGSVWGCPGSGVRGRAQGRSAAVPAGRVLGMAAQSPRGSPSLVGSQQRQIPDTRVVQARRGSLALPGPWEPPGRPSPPAPPGEELKGRPGGHSAAGSCTMPAARSVLILAGLLALWAELPAASAQNDTSEYERMARHGSSRHARRAASIPPSQPQGKPAWGPGRAAACARRGRARQHPWTQPWGRGSISRKGTAPSPCPAPAAPRLPTPPHCLAAKAGVCPSPAVDAVNCTVGCQSDGDCESTLKCCPAACGKACQKPDGNTPSCSWPRCPESVPLPQASGPSRPALRVLQGAAVAPGLGARCVFSCRTGTGGCTEAQQARDVLLMGHAHTFLLSAMQGLSGHP